MSWGLISLFIGIVCMLVSVATWEDLSFPSPECLLIGVGFAMFSPIIMEIEKWR